MLKQIIILILIYTPNTLFAQNSTCCTAHDQFAALSDDVSFVNKHEEPIPFNYVADKGFMTTYPCMDGKDANAFVIPAKEKTNKYLIVVHEWWGLNDYIKQFSEKFYDDMNGEVNIIALDLYDGKVATNRDSAKIYMSSLDQQRAKEIMMGAIQKAGSDAEVATIGWCMGGGYSLQTSILLKEQGKACVIYYGYPETDKEKLKELQAPVLMIWPNQDKGINIEVVTQFKTDMLALNKNIRVEEYDADHAFANPSNPKYNKELADDAYKKSLSFLKDGLKIK